MDVVGTVVAQRYELKKVIGQGGQGIVCRALDRRTGRAVAVKMLTGADAHKPEYAARLAREQQAMIALAGTSAVAVLDLCKAPNGSLCLVMELLEGVDLEDHFESLEKRGLRMDPQALYDTFDPIVDTLERAHDAGILHRDLKPGNIFLISERAGGGVRLLDFGLSRMKTDTPLTEVGTVLGSPSYIAPEAWRGQPEAVDHRADVYSFNVLVFRALTGHLPFQGTSLYEKFKLATTAPRPSLHALRPDLSRDLDAWVEQALAIDRERRFTTIRASWRALFKALRYTPTPRMIRPVADSLVNAWRAATTAFRRFIDPVSPPMPPTTGGPLIASAVVEVGRVESRPARSGSTESDPPASRQPATPDHGGSNPSDRPTVLPLGTSSSVFPRPEELVDDDDWIDPSEVELLDDDAPSSSATEASGQRSLIDTWLSSAPPAPLPASPRPSDSPPRGESPVERGQGPSDGATTAAASEALADSPSSPAAENDPSSASPLSDTPEPCATEASADAGGHQAQSEVKTHKRSRPKQRPTKAAAPKKAAKKKSSKKKSSKKKSSKKKSSKKKSKSDSSRGGKKARRRATTKSSPRSSES